eukprot:2328347-Rhodomonas_salina.1
MGARMWLSHTSPISSFCRSGAMNSLTRHPHWSRAEPGADVAATRARLARVSQSKAPAGQAGTSLPQSVCEPGGESGCFAWKARKATSSASLAMTSE